MKRIIENHENCEECGKGKPKYICTECDNIYCKKCAEMFDFECMAHEEPRLIPIIKSTKKG